MTPLIECGWDADAALELIKAGANVNARSKEGYTPLINAPAADVVRVLLENGADLSARDKDGKTALDLARMYSMKDKAAVLEDPKYASK
jgi:ankyrin repeat protein